MIVFITAPLPTAGSFFFANMANEITTTDDKLLQVFDNIKKSIAEIDDIKKLQDIRNLAKGYQQAWEAHWRTSGMGRDQMFYGWEAKVRAERKMGKILSETEFAKNQHDATNTKLAAFGITDMQSHRYQKLVEILEDEFDKKILEIWASFKEPTTAGLFKAAHVSYNSGDNEWYTPSIYIEAARKTMGNIDLDPASSPEANRIVRATKFFTEEDNGLTKEWEGNVWMNPPYSQPLIEKFVNKFVESYKIQQACVLVNNATETAWFQKLLKPARGVCFVKGRVKFIDKEGKASGTPLQGQAILYYGRNTTKFNSNFKEFGTILWNSEDK